MGERWGKREKGRKEGMKDRESKTEIEGKKRKRQTERDTTM